MMMMMTRWVESISIAKKVGVCGGESEQIRRNGLHCRDICGHGQYWTMEEDVHHLFWIENGKEAEDAAWPFVVGTMGDVAIIVEINAVALPPLLPCCVMMQQMTEHGQNDAGDPTGVQDD